MPRPAARRGRRRGGRARAGRRPRRARAPGLRRRAARAVQGAAPDPLRRRDPEGRRPASCSGSGWPSGSASAAARDRRRDGRPPYRFLEHELIADLGVGARHARARRRPTTSSRSAATRSSAPRRSRASGTSSATPTSRSSRSSARRRRPRMVHELRRDRRRHVGHRPVARLGDDARPADADPGEDLVSHRCRRRRPDDRREREIVVADELPGCARPPRPRGSSPLQARRSRRRRRGRGCRARTAHGGDRFVLEEAVGRPGVVALSSRCPVASPPRAPVRRMRCTVRPSGDLVDEGGDPAT